MFQKGKYVFPYLPAGGVPPEVAEGCGEPTVDVVESELLVGSLHDSLRTNQSQMIVFWTLTCQFVWASFRELDSSNFSGVCVCQVMNENAIKILRIITLAT